MTGKESGAEANRYNSLSSFPGSNSDGGRAKLQELSGPVVSQAYKLAWEREYLDLTELARLRWVEGWKIERLADFFEVSRTAVKERLRAIKKNLSCIGIRIPKKQIYGK